MDQKTFILVSIILIVVGATVYFIVSGQRPFSPVNSFEECVAVGHPVMESYPRQCRAKDKTFTEYIGNELEKMDLIRINSPRPNQLIQSPLVIEGEARGYWFFEADFPVRLYDDKGQELGTAIAHALSEWMTEDFIGFQVELNFSIPVGEKGTLVLEKDNPSGLQEYADELLVPVRFR
ncbi:MAG: Gmad2 immunoglobulin-like domain-containing protein [Candidatus Nealsonbacteria bacterium]